jgi:hypothetical protein
VSELTGEVTREVKDLNGLLVRRFAMRTVGEGAAARSVPYNVTFFRYDGRHAHLELADAAYTFVTNEDGQVELTDAGGRREFVPVTHPPLNATPAAFSYFAHTEIVDVDLNTQRIHYRVNVKDAAGQRDVERYREIKNADGDLIQRQVGHRSGATFRADEVTINSGFWNGVARNSRSYTIRYLTPTKSTKKEKLLSRK